MVDDSACQKLFPEDLPLITDQSVVGDYFFRHQFLKGLRFCLDNLRLLVLVLRDTRHQLDEFEALH